MATDIYFAAKNVRIQVHEDATQVAEAFASARGLPFRLTRPERRGAVYVNPLTVAFWRDAEPGPAPELGGESTQPRTERQLVTDVWGQPLGGRPRG